MKNFFSICFKKISLRFQNIYVNINRIHIFFETAQRHSTQNFFFLLFKVSQSFFVLICFVLFFDVNFSFLHSSLSSELYYQFWKILQFFVGNLKYNFFCNFLHVSIIKLDSNTNTITHFFGNP